jgi:hypothetical protein
MGDGTNVDPDELHSYAGTLRDRATSVDDAAGAVAGIDLGFAPYGTINQWFGDIVREGADGVTAQLRTLAAALNGDADTLDASAGDFTHQDDTTAEGFRRMSQGE